MIGASKILTVSYGTFSCTLEGFDEPFNTMKAIAEYFRDLAAEDRYFGAEPPTPDAAMLHRIAEREIQRRVEAKIQDNGVILRAADVELREADVPSAATTIAATAIAAPSVAAVAQDTNGESIAARLSRLRSAQDDFPPAVTTTEPSIKHVSEAAAIADEAYTEDQHADDISQNILSHVTAFTAAPQADASNLNDDFDQVEVDFNHATSALDDLIAAEVVADRSAPVLGFDDSGFEDEETDLYAPEATLATDFDQDLAFADQQAEFLPEDLSTTVSDDAQWQGDADGDNHIMDSINGLIEHNDQAAQPESLTPRQQRRLAHHIAAVEAAKAAATRDALIEQTDQLDETDDDLLLASLSTLEIPAPAATDKTDLLPEMRAEDSAPITPPEPIFTAEAAPQPSDNIQRARARVIKIRRADAPTAPVLSAEAEADLEAELASLRAEEPVAPTRPTRPVRNLAPRAPIAPTSNPVDATSNSAEDDDQLTAALAAMQADEVATLEPQPTASAPRAETAQHTESRKLLETESDDAAVSRLMEATNTAMDGAENRRRHAAISHLKAAVAATEAERQIKAINPGKPAPDRQDIYRNDLESVVRPRSVETRSVETRAEARAASNAERPSPLVLVSEQRIDRPKGVVAAPAPAPAPVAPRMVLPSRPRRVAPSTTVASATAASATVASVATATSLQMNDTLLGNADDDLDEDDIFDAAEDANYFAPSETFDDFVDKLGATTLPELLEASAVYCAQVLGRPLFSRTMVMHQVQTLIDAPDHNLEDSLRGFGTLLRQGRLAKIKRGHFAVTDRSPMLAEALRIAG